MSGKVKQCIETKTVTKIRLSVSGPVETKTEFYHAQNAQKKTKPVSVVRHHAPLEMVTVDLVVLPAVPVETSGKGKKKQTLYKR